MLDSAGEQDVVVSGPDFVSDPRWSPDGASLAWLEWDHPAMPWDASTLKVQTGMGVVTVAGGVDQPAEGVCQPQWAPDGSLWFCTDRNDWWSLYRWTPEAGVEQMLNVAGEVGGPKWQFGTRGTPSSATAGSSSRCCTRARTRRTCSNLTERLIDLPVGCTCVDAVAAGDTVVLIGPPRSRSRRS